jgi:hypothetical protein
MRFLQISSDSLIKLFQRAEIVAERWFAHANFASRIWKVHVTNMGRQTEPSSPICSLRNAISDTKDGLAICVKPFYQTKHTILRLCAVDDFRVIGTHISN